MYSFIIRTINLLIKGIGLVVTAVFSVLPDSPFQKYIIENSIITKYVGMINYFLPVAEILVVMEAWCVAISIFYVVQIVLRWIKAIE